MQEAAVRAFMGVARACAMAMLGNATYIRNELPNVQMSPALLQRTEEVCDALVGTKHDIMTELSELDDLLAGGAPDSVVAARVERIARWMGEDVERLHELVMALEGAKDQNAEYTLAYVLVIESAANVMGAFNPVKAQARELGAIR